MQLEPKIVALGAVAAIAILGVFAAGAFFVASRAPMTGDLRAAADELFEEQEPYEPTSEWIEEGLDPEVTTFGFGGKDAPAPSGPELSEAELHNLVIARQNDLMPCYAAVLAEVDVQGAVDFQFGVAPDGHVAMVRVTGSELESPAAEDCMVEKSRGWRFPPTNRASLMKFDTDFTFAYE